MMSFNFRSIFIFSLVLVASATSWPKASLQAQSVTKGGQFVIHLRGAPLSLHPLKSEDIFSAQVLEFALEGLMRRNKKTYKWEPALAESYKENWTKNKKGKKKNKFYTFKIKKGVKFHDGKSVTAHDVKFTYDSIKTKDEFSFRRSYYDGIEKVKVVDDHTIIFYCKSRYFKNFDAIAQLFALPRHVYDAKSKEVEQKLIGTGPYYLEEYASGKWIKLKKFKDWHGYKNEVFKDSYNYDSIKFQIIPDMAQAFKELKKGKINFMRLNSAQYLSKEEGQEAISKHKVENKIPGQLSFIAWNLKSPLFSSRSVRLALAYLMNRELVNETYKANLSALARGPWVNNSPFASPRVKPIFFDPKRAALLLKEEGWIDRDKDDVLEKKIDGIITKLEFTLVYSGNGLKKAFTLYKEDLKKLGIVLNLKELSWAELLELKSQSKFEALSLAWSSSEISFDPKQIWHSESQGQGGSNFMGYSSPKVDKLINQARITQSAKRRSKKFKAAYEEISKDAPYLFMFSQKYWFYATTKDVQKPQLTYDYHLGYDTWWTN